MQSLLVFVIFVVLITQPTPSTATVPHHPVVLLPGLMASIIESKADVPLDAPFPNACPRQTSWFRNWISPSVANPFSSSCYFAYLHGRWNTSTNALDNLPGVSTRVPLDRSGLYALDRLFPVPFLGALSDVFHGLIAHLKAKGYQEGVDLFGLPYDWRSLVVSDVFVARVRETLHAAYAATGRPAVLVSHSMGGLVTYKLLDRLGAEFCRKYVAHWLAVSTPFGGSGVAVKALLDGETLGLPVNKQHVRALARSTDSIVGLLPVPDIWQARPILHTSTTNHTAADLAVVFRNDPEIAPKLAFHRELHKMYRKHGYRVPHGVPMTAVISTGTPTVDSLTLGSSPSGSPLLDGAVVGTGYSDGDGLVNALSLHAARLFSPRVHDIGRHSHLGILSSRGLFSVVDSLIPASASPSPPASTLPAA